MFDVIKFLIYNSKVICKFPRNLDTLTFSYPCCSAPLKVASAVHPKQKHHTGIRKAFFGADFGGLAIEIWSFLIVNY